MRANISGIEVEGTAEEIGSLLRSYLKPASTTMAPTASASGLTCPTCGMGGFKTPATVRMHVSHMKDEAHEKVREKDSYRHFKKDTTGSCLCSCDRSFKNNQALHHHQTITGHARREISSAAGSSSAPEFICDVCDQGFVSQHRLDLHKANVHGGDPEPSIPTPDEPQTIKHYIFVCKVGPTEVRHAVDGTSPTTAIEAHDKANPNHRFVTALNKVSP